MAESTQADQQQSMKPHEMHAITGRRKALLIGINYTGTSAALRGCVNDVKRIKGFLTNKGFPDTPETMLVLTDDGNNDPNKKPTKANMLAGLKWLLTNVAAGDSLFLHYSGHGGRVADTNGDEDDGFDETIIPLDYESAGQIVDDDLHKIVCEPLPKGARLTVIFDSCHSGTALDLPFIFDNNNLLPAQEVKPDAPAKKGSPIGGILKKISSVIKGKGGKGALGTAANLGSTLLNLAGDYIEKNGVPINGFFPQGATANEVKTGGTQAVKPVEYGDVIMFSGCKDAQTSMDVSSNGTAGGAMSTTFLEVMTKNNGTVSYLTLLSQIRDVMKGKFEQIVQMSTSYTIDMQQNFAI
ncbi:putative cysteine protease [Planoprotostelium fungivorum]|uniref:Putative cysteine protease n=1 Tax=Planoprotostelium fungivorum TaxID=1890364 RepID=A0A2P6NK16_9EUKA|nr:putative cysteine protease [Planoprotostelium fungivorum]